MRCMYDGPSTHHDTPQLKLHGVLFCWACLLGIGATVWELAAFWRYTCDICDVSERAANHPLTEEVGACVGANHCLHRLCGCGY